MANPKGVTHLLPELQSRPADETKVFVGVDNLNAGVNKSQKVEFTFLRSLINLPTVSASVGLLDGLQVMPIIAAQDFTITGDKDFWRQIITSPFIGDGKPDDELSAVVVPAGIKVTLQDVAVLNSRGYGIEVQDGGELIMNHCWVCNSFKDGVFAPNGKVTIDQSLIENCGSNANTSQVNCNDSLITRSILDGFHGRGPVIQGKGRVSRTALIGDILFTGTWSRDRNTAVIQSANVPAQGHDAGNHVLVDFDAFAVTYPTPVKSLIRPHYRVLMILSNDFPAGFGMYDFDVTIDQAYATARWGNLGHTYVLKTGETPPKQWVSLPFFPGETP